MSDQQQPGGPDEHPQPDTTQPVPPVPPEPSAPEPTPTYADGATPPAGPQQTQQPSYPPYQEDHWAQQPYTPVQEQPAKKKTWIPITAAVVAALVVGGLGTAAALDAFDDDSSSSLATVGENEDRSDVDGPVEANGETPDWEAVSAAVAPSVVSIQVSSGQSGAEGSGVVMDDEGHVLTNNHVVSGADQVQVTLSDGTLYPAEIVGTDDATDLAVVQIQDPPDDLTPATFGDSDGIEVGEPVMAVGNPLGLANTATTGIVSAIDRPVQASGEDGSTTVVTNAIQIDAAVNPGNSGGPLFDSEGRVIGITSSIATLSDGTSQSGSIGLGFAIPVNLALDVGEQLIESGSAEHAFLGVTLADTTVTADGVTRLGTEVGEVTPGSAADEGGIQAGDVIVAIDGDPVSGAASLTGYVRERRAGEVSTITLVRDGKTQDVDVTFQTRAAEEEAEESPNTPNPDEEGDGSQIPDEIPDWLRDLLEQRG
ncbi:putative serine protease PepD [Paraoerskovia marina]|uniref:Putative serine protease PepD n=1 Tax=Paraoerskovia marina TaxID=545619 RepID=A0A1H1VKS6_9CELL|nr:trypsin-like peptidase domain-containing protein [Paraoerskovia marina]SDS84639.1 putative serine protease PepD [Paraoerskovia marina]